MANPAIHALIIIVAIIIPGGMLAYIAWRLRKANLAKAAKAREVDPVQEIRDAFLNMYPPNSLRAKEKRRRLDMRKRRPKAKFPK